MRIAIAAVLFDDTTRIGSQRARALARELSKLGNDVTVFTQGTPESPPLDDPFPALGVDVVRLGPYSGELWPTSGWHGLIRKALTALVIAPTVLPLARLRRRTGKGSATSADAGRIADMTSRRRSSVLRLDQLLSTHIWIRTARQELEGENLAGQPFDVVFSTFDPLGRMLKKVGIARKWVVDFRDPAYDAHFLPAVAYFLRHYQDSLLRDGDWITTVSNGVKQALTRSRTGKRRSSEITVITNGFTPRTPTPPPASTGKGPLNLVYTGALYKDRIPELERLLIAMTKLSEGGAAAELHYAGRDGHIVQSVATKVGAIDVIRDHGLVTYEESLELQSSADALVVFSWNTEDQQGVLSGKFLEYLGANRPILALVAGDLANSEIDRVIVETQIGVCFEEARGQRDQERLEDWVTESARLREEGEPLPFMPLEGAVQNYSYPTIAQRLEKLLFRIGMCAEA